MPVLWTVFNVINMSPWLGNKGDLYNISYFNVLGPKIF